MTPAQIGAALEAAMSNEVLACTSEGIAITAGNASTIRTRIAQRLANETPQYYLGLGDLTFTPSVDTVTSYEVRVYAEGTTSSPVATQNIGVPTPDASTGKIRVNIRSILDNLAAGNYQVTVAATGAGGTSESAQTFPYTVPLALP